MQDTAASDRQYPVHESLSGENVSLHSWSIFHLYGNKFPDFNDSVRTPRSWHPIPSLHGK